MSVYVKTNCSDIVHLTFVPMLSQNVLLHLNLYIRPNFGNPFNFLPWEKLRLKSHMRANKQ